MPTVITTETRTDTTTLFFNERPAFIKLHNEVIAAYLAIPAVSTIETSEDGLVRTYTITVDTDEKLLQLHQIHDDHLNNVINLQIKLDEPYLHTTTRSFDSIRTERLYMGMPV